MSDTTVLYSVIKKLPSLICDRIAAGEVIERPASVVRELIDNAVDAGATNIDILTTEGGITKIEVSDDGIGMVPEDLRASFLRHTTSKIYQFEDIYKIYTMGFRGEALASIASVSLLEIESKHKHQTDSVGLTLEIEDGAITKEKPMNRVHGTSVRVHNLFYNVPVRARFLKTASTEIRYIKNECIVKSLPFHQINVELNHNNKVLLSSKRSDSPLSRIQDFFTKELVEQLVPIENSEASKTLSISLTGYISKPTFFVNHKRLIYTYVNGRPITTSTLQHAIFQAYESIIPSHYYPAVFLFFSIPPDTIDVNIHPTKKEIKFDNEGFIHSFLVRSIRKTIGAEMSSFTEYSSQAPKKVNPNFPNSFSVGRSENATPHQDTSRPSFSTPSGNHPMISSEGDHPGGHYKPTAHPLDIYPSKSMLTPTRKDIPANDTDTLGSLKWIGNAFNNYLILEDPEGLILIDQHAAHERINFEKLRKRMLDRTFQVQKMLIPALIEVSAIEESLIQSSLHLFESVGFTLQPFGDRAFLLETIPDFVPKNKEKLVILEVIKRLEENKEINQSVIIEEYLRTEACHQSIRSGDEQTVEETMTLIRDLFQTTNPFTCPHGRPIAIRIQKVDLEKRFNRDGF